MLVCRTSADFRPPVVGTNDYDTAQTWFGVPRSAVSAQMPRPLALIVLLFLPERHVEAIQSLAACSIKLEGRLPADCTVPAYDYTALCSTTGSPPSSCCTTSPVPFPPAGTVSKAAPTSLSELIERTEAVVAEIVKTAVPEVSDLCDFREGCSCSRLASSDDLGNTVCYSGLGDIEGCPNPPPAPPPLEQGSGDSAHESRRMLNIEESLIRIAPDTPTPFSETYKAMSAWRALNEHATWGLPPPSSHLRLLPTIPRVPQSARPAALTTRSRSSSRRKMIG